MEDERRYKIIRYNDHGFGYETKVWTRSELRDWYPQLEFLQYEDDIDSLTVRFTDGKAMSVDVTTKTRLELRLLESQEVCR